MKRINVHKIPRGKQIFLIASIIGLITTSMFAVSTTTSLPVSGAAAHTTDWNVTLRITEQSGIGNTVILGEKTNASNGQDQYDLPEPPAPPQFPFLLTWFDTPFSKPFDKLLEEYKHAPSSSAQWNLSVVWFPDPGNTNLTTVEIRWDHAQVASSGYDSFLLYEKNTTIANMLTQESYNYSTNGTIHHFQIIAHSEPTPEPSPSNGLPGLPVISGVILVIIIIIAILFIFIKRRKH